MAKKNIKEEILNTARRLFNERGYNSVSMRDIAAALSISVGNLTYHYAKKEALMEAVVMEMHRYYTPPIIPQNLQQLNAIFARQQNVIQENAFYFWHYTQLSQLSPAINEMQTEKVQDQYNMLVTAFKNLCVAGLLEAEVYTGHYLQLAQAVQIVCTYWVPQSKLDLGESAPRDFLDCVWSVLLPALTPKGQDVYWNKIQKVRVAYE